MEKRTGCENEADVWRLQASCFQRWWQWRGEQHLLKQWDDSYIHASSHYIELIMLDQIW